MKPVALLALCATLAISPAALAHEDQDNHPMKGHPMMDHHRMEEHMNRMWKEFHLTPDQKKQMQTLHQQDRPKMAAAHQAVKAEERTLSSLFADPNATDAQLNAEHDKLQSAIDQAMSLHFHHMLAMRALMTPEQRARFGKMAKGWMHEGPMGGMMEHDED